jgi:hypothetical protein
MSPALYGRSEDVAALCDLIRHHALVTVVGSAGIGKTRLAQAVAHELEDEFADGARLVELAPFADPDLVAATVTRALGLAVGDPHTALDLIVQALASQRLLLVLDNCEHLLEAVDRVVAALRKGSPPCTFSPRARSCFDIPTSMSIGWARWDCPLRSPRLGRTRWRSPHCARASRGFWSGSGLPDESGRAMGRLAVVQGVEPPARRLHSNGGCCPVLARLRRARHDSVA